MRYKYLKYDSMNAGAIAENKYMSKFMPYYYAIYLLL